MTRACNAYLDVETTGLSSFCDDITVIRMYWVNGCDGKLIQLVGNEVTADNLLEALEDANTIYTYNGSSLTSLLFVLFWVWI